MKRFPLLFFYVSSPKHEMSEHPYTDDGDLPIRRELSLQPQPTHL